MRDDVATRLAAWEHVDRAYSGELLDSLVTGVLSGLPAVTRNVWHEFLMPYHGAAFRDQLQAVAWRVAGNYMGLMSGNVPPIWCSATPAHWAAILLTCSWPGRTFSGAAMSWYRFTVLTGPAAGQIGELRWASGYLSVLARAAGYGARNGDWYFEHPAELVNLWFVGKVVGLAKSGGPRLSAVHVPTPYRDRNRKIVSLRRRLDYGCPKNFNHECSDCYVGFGDCAGATHRITWRKATCQQCGDIRVFDDDLSQRICRACFFKERLK